MTAAQAVELVRPGDRVWVGSACWTTRALLAALDADLDTPTALAELGMLAAIALDGAAADLARHEAARQIGELGGRVMGLRLDDGGAPPG